ncbi:MAG TPA: DALR domain-containing protein, partial [Bacillota bacterium]|nr:DALR domain-containing protein [Bacillota bacterium]
MNLTEDTEEWFGKIDEWKKQFEKEMYDDFNTANAISVLFEFIKEANQYLQLEQTATEVIEKFQETISAMLGILGLEVTEDTSVLLDEEIERLIEERNEARKNRNFARADEIRDMLKEKGIILEDTPQGVRWKRG